MGFQRKNMFESNGITSIFAWRNKLFFSSNLHKEHKMGPSLAWPPLCFLLKFCLCYMFYSSRSFALAFCFTLVFFVACSFLVICFTSLNSSCIVVQLLLHLSCLLFNQHCYLILFFQVVSKLNYLSDLAPMYAQFFLHYCLALLALLLLCQYPFPHLLCVGLGKRNLKLLNCVASSIISSTNYNLIAYTFVFSYPLFQFIFCNHS